MGTRVCLIEDVMMDCLGRWLLSEHCINGRFGKTSIDGHGVVVFQMWLSPLEAIHVETVLVHVGWN
jgi:hypothetical protein